MRDRERLAIRDKLREITALPGVTFVDEGELFSWYAADARVHAYVAGDPSEMRWWTIRFRDGQMEPFQDHPLNRDALARIEQELSSIAITEPCGA